MRDPAPGRSQLGGLLGRASEVLSDRAGYAVVPTADLDLLEAAWDELRATNRELDLLGWQVLDYMGGQPQEMSTMSRRKMVQKSRYVWMNDPQAGASVSLKNDFTFGRGVPAPTGKDELVQDALDDFWNDADNKRAITTYARQITMGTDLALQSNLFFLVFDDGDDGKVKLTVLDHDTVENYVRDEENPNRILYWLVKPKPYKWDFNLDRPDTTIRPNQKPVYYEDWSGVREVENEIKEGTRDQASLPKPPSGRLEKGRVYHIAVNRFSGQVFGVPEFQRTIRWYSAYNDFMKARVDIAQAAASFIMKRKVKGTASQLARTASKALSRRSDVAGGTEAGLVGPPRPGSIIQENDAVSHENFNLNSQAGNAQQDAHMIRAPISAATRFPQAYYGDESNTSLATATSLELPVLKAVEAIQEMFEQLYRDMLDRVIERAVEVGKISEERTPEELAAKLAPEAQLALAASARRLVAEDESVLTVLAATHRVVGTKREGYTLRTTLAYEALDDDGETKVLREAHEDATVDEKDTKRDLGYEIKFPSPLRRMMGDLVTACQNIAATCDPNNTNLELTKALATIMFGEALEIQDPADLVEKIWPPGYEDPLVAAAKAQASQQQQGPNPFGPASTGQPIPHGGDGAYPGGSSGQAQLPEDLRSGPYNAQQAAVEEGLREKNDLVRSRVRGQSETVSAMFDSDVVAVAGAALRRIQIEQPKRRGRPEPVNV